MYSSYMIIFFIDAINNVEDVLHNVCVHDYHRIWGKDINFPNFDTCIFGLNGPS